jgi:hypothetical protein
MEMFLMLLAMCLLGTAVSAALFGAATRGQKREPWVQALRRPTAPQRFFAQDEAARKAPHAPAPTADTPLPPQPVPLDLLLLQIERHVRLEQAAAESFHETPTGESLHSRTASPLVN